MNNQTIIIYTNTLFGRAILLMPQFNLTSKGHLVDVAKNTIYNAKEQDNMDLVYTGNRRFFRSKMPGVIELGLDDDNELYQITPGEYKLTYSEGVENCLKYILTLQQEEAERVHAELEEIKHIVSSKRHQ